MRKRKQLSRKIVYHLQSINISKRAIRRLIAGKPINRARYSASQNTLIDLLEELIAMTERRFLIRLVAASKKKKFVR